MGFTKWMLSSLGVDTTTEEDIKKKYPSYFNIETAKEDLKRRRVRIISDANLNKHSYDHNIHVDNVKTAVEKGVLPVYYKGAVVGTFNIHRYFLIPGEYYVLCGELGLNKNTEFEVTNGRFYLRCDYDTVDMSEGGIKYYAATNIHSFTLTFTKP